MSQAIGIDTAVRPALTLPFDIFESQILLAAGYGGQIETLAEPSFYPSLDRFDKPR